MNSSLSLFSPNLRESDDQETLSLSLSFHDRNLMNSTTHHHHHRNSIAPMLGTNRNIVPLGPFTGYASILKQSRYMKPAQLILDDLCSLAFTSPLLMDSFIPGKQDSNFLAPPPPPPPHHHYKSDTRWQSSRLISMLDEVYRRYKLYYQQVQSAVASFESVSGLGNAAPYMSLAFKVVFNHFSCLKKAISDQIQLTGNAGKNEGLLNRQNHMQNSTFSQIPICRPQRGLPDQAVALLRRWLFENFLHPYPLDSEKQMLARQTGLSKTQVSNWFINARVRLWKPMVEEIHMLEEHKAEAPMEMRAKRRRFSRNGDIDGSESSSSRVTLALSLHQNNSATFPVQNFWQ